MLQRFVSTELEDSFHAKHCTHKIDLFPHTVSIITKLMYVEAVKTRSQTTNRVVDLGRSVLARLGEFNGTGDAGVTPDNCDSLDHIFFFGELFVVEWDV